MNEKVEQMEFGENPEKAYGVAGSVIFSSCIATHDFSRLLAAAKRTTQTADSPSNGYSFIRLDFDDVDGTVTSVSLDGYRLCTLKVWLPGPITGENKNMTVYIRPDVPKPKKCVPVVGVYVVESMDTAGNVERTAYIKYGDVSYGCKQPMDAKWGIDWKKTLKDATVDEPIASVTVNAEYLLGVLASRLDADRGVVSRPLVTIELRGETKPVLIYGSRQSESVGMVLPVRSSRHPNTDNAPAKVISDEVAAEKKEGEVSDEGVS